MNPLGENACGELLHLQPQPQVVHSLSAEFLSFGFDPYHDSSLVLKLIHEQLHMKKQMKSKHQMEGVLFEGRFDEILDDVVHRSLRHQGLPLHRDGIHYAAFDAIESDS